MARTRQILAIGGMALPPELDNLRLVKYFLEQTKRRRPKVLYVGTATGDAEIGTPALLRRLQPVRLHGPRI